MKEMDKKRQGGKRSYIRSANLGTASMALSKLVFDIENPGAGDK